MKKAAGETRYEDCFLIGLPTEVRMSLRLLLLALLLVPTGVRLAAGPPDATGRLGTYQLHADVITPHGQSSVNLNEYIALSPGGFYSLDVCPQPGPHAYRGHYTIRGSDIEFFHPKIAGGATHGRFVGGALLLPSTAFGSHAPRGGPQGPLRFGRSRFIKMKGSDHAKI